MTTVLVIDDEDMVRATLRQLLERRGFEVVEAQDGEEGQRLFRSRRADVVICDIIMPRSEGIGTIMGIRRMAPDVPIIAMSGGGRAHALELLQVAEQFGADHVLEKPFRMAQLLDLVQQGTGARKEVALAR